MEGLIRLTDALFGGAKHPYPSGRRWLARYLALAGVLALIVFVRRPDSILRPQFWAEDGTIFFYEQLTLGFWSALRALYFGFPFLIQRLVASLASVVPTVSVPLAYNASAIAITALTMASFSLPGFRHLVRSDGVRVAVCIASVCIPSGVGGQELLATPTTLFYFLAIWLVFLSVAQAPRTPAVAAAWCLGGALAVLSVPLAPIAAPLWLLRAVRGVSRRDGRDLAFAATQTAAQLVVFGLAGLLSGGTELPGGVPVYEWPPGYFRALGWMIASCIDSALFSMAAFEHLERLGVLAVVAPAVLLAVGVAIAFRDLSEGGRITVCLAIYLLVASFCLILVGRPIIVLLLQGVVPNVSVSTRVVLGSRHRVVPSVALVLIAAALIDGAQRARIRVAAAAAYVGLLVAGAPEFRIAPLPDLHWPLWAARLDKKLASGSREPLVIPSHPARLFDIAFDSSPSPTPNAQHSHDESHSRH